MIASWQLVIGVRVQASGRVRVIEWQQEGNWQESPILWKSKQKAIDCRIAARKPYNDSFYISSLVCALQ